MNTVERVKAICKERKIPISRLEKACGFANGYISQLKKGSIPDDRLQKIAKFLNVGIDELMGEQESSAPTRIPVLGRVAAGIPIDAIEDILDWEDITPSLASTGKYFGLRIKGDSMQPRIIEGDVVIVRCQPDAESGDVVIVQVNGDAATCKRLSKHPSGISLISFNPAYEPMVYTNEEIESLPVTIIGKVVENRQKY